MAVFEDDDLHVIANTREDWRRWRASSTPVRDATHALLEVALALGLVVRLWAHLLAHGFYTETVEDESPRYGEADLHWGHLVAPMLDARTRRQEAAMRVHSVAWGLAIWGAHEHTGTGVDVVVVALTAGYLLLDPVLGLAWWIAGRPS